MVCKEDVVSWFKGSKSHTRLDVMCNLFNLCLPFELRFLGTCLEDLGKRDYQDLRPSELGANNPSELNSADFQSISDKRTRTKLAIFISMLHSCNTVCANGFYKLLANVEEVNNLIKGSGVPGAEDEILEELLLIYTLALNHPAFNFEQKLFFGEVFTKLRQEEERRSNFRRTKCIQGSPGGETVDKHQIQNYQPCPSPEQHQAHRNLPTPPMNPAALTGDPLVSLNSNPMDWTIPYSMMPSGFLPHPTHPMPVMMPPPTSAPAPAPAPESRSPLVSRTNSPCQSNSPSRAGSPGRPKQLPPFNRPPPAPAAEPTPAPPNHQGKGPSVEQLRSLSDDELREQGWSNQCISQLRTLETKIQTTNGYSVGNKRPEPDHYPEPTPTPAPTPTPTPTTAVSAMPLRRFNGMDGPPLIVQYVTPIHCTACMRFPKQVPTQFVNNFRAMSLEGDHDRHNSSTSDSASDHSPPDTPSLSNTGPPSGAPAESWDELRVPESGEERRPMGVVSMPGRGRGNRSTRSNPPGMPILPRGSGRGHNPSQRRRDSNAANGTHEERKAYQTPESPAAAVPFPAFSGHFLPPGQFIQAFPTFTSQGGVFRLPFPPSPNGEMLYHPHPLPPPAAGQFLPTRPSPPAPAPAHMPFSPLVPPPKISCYNCGSQSHIGPDCPELTMEEITNKGIFRLDYSGNSTYQKPGDCSTTQDK